MKLLTWNVNSIRARINHLKDILKNINPEIVCLQETKVTNLSFPKKEIQSMGYEFNYTNGMPGYNGVCILSKNKATEVKCINWCSKNDSRHIQIKVNGINVHSLYVPAGGDEPDQKRNPKFKHKIDFLDELTSWIKKNKHT
ncbi:MAG: hypothetical protein CMP41_01525 [Rickettsiales bacterium]|nr:hypothetical protein [Rickettsiales bacterium]